MNEFENYAHRIIDSLPEPQKILDEQFQSPLERVIWDLEGQLVEVDLKKDTFDPPSADDHNRISDEVPSIENGILASGLEALAFYKSIHYENAPPYPGKWGVFIFDYALKYLAGEIETAYPAKFSFTERFDKAKKLLYFHERFHYRFDCWVISHESAQKQPLYENYRNAVYWPLHPHECVYEESLANLHALKSISRESIASFARHFMLSQPGAYSNIVGVTREEFLAKLAAQTFQGLPRLPDRRLPEHVQFIANSKDDKRHDLFYPVYKVIGVSPSRFVIPSITLPTLSEIEKGFIRSYLNGRESKRTDHKYVIDNGQKIKLPNPHRRNITLHEFSNIIKKAGLVQKDFYGERERTRVWKEGTPRLEIKPSLIGSVYRSWR